MKFITINQIQLGSKMILNSLTDNFNKYKYRIGKIIFIKYQIDEDYYDDYSSF